MSVTWRPPRMYLAFFAVLLCLVTAFPLAAQQEEIPAAAAEQSEAVSEASAADSAPVAIAPEVPVEPLPVSVEPEEEPQDEPVSEPTAAPVVTTPAETSVSQDMSREAVAKDAAVKKEEAVAQKPAAQEESKASVAQQAPAAAGKTEVPAKVEEKKEEKTGIEKYVEVSRLNVLIIIVFLLGFVSYFTFHAQRGKELFIRRISGLSALEDAVGRATEMGRGVLYIPGIMDMDDIQTIAGVTILGHVAKKTAEYDTPLYAPMTRSFVMSVAQEVVKQAYLEKGRPDAFRPDRINYLTDDQFGYVAGVGGIMMRDKPAACFYLGTFYAESLILAETGNSIGAIQIAGTAEPSQIPFFVAACDYTLIGEELFAASAYLSKNPKEVGSLKGQDISKICIIAFIIIGTVLVTVAQTQWGEEHGFVKTIAESYMKLFK
ncbi:MAG: hypothetical protein Kow0029_29770 [Candidatus Rifleibacteriota bacterium]